MSQGGREEASVFSHSSTARIHNRTKSKAWDPLAYGVLKLMSAEPPSVCVCVCCLGQFALSLSLLHTL